MIMVLEMTNDDTLRYQGDAAVIRYSLQAEQIPGASFDQNLSSLHFQCVVIVLWSPWAFSYFSYFVTHEWIPAEGLEFTVQTQAIEMINFVIDPWQVKEQGFCD